MVNKLTLLILIFASSFQAIGQDQQRVTVDGYFYVQGSYYYKIESYQKVVRNIPRFIKFESRYWTTRNLHLATPGGTQETRYNPIFPPERNDVVIWEPAKKEYEELTFVFISYVPRPGYTKVEGGTRFESITVKPLNPQAYYPNIYHVDEYGNTGYQTAHFLDNEHPIIWTNVAYEEPKILNFEDIPRDQFPWYYTGPPRNEANKKVGQKNFTVQRYYVLEAKDSFDGDCNVIIMIDWSFSLRTLEQHSLSTNQFCNFNVSANVFIHDYYIQNLPIEDGQYIHEFESMYIPDNKIYFASSEEISSTGRFYYSPSEDIEIDVKYNSLSVISGVREVTSRDFKLTVPVREKFTFH